MSAIVLPVRPRRVLARWRPVITAETLILLVAAFIAIADNVPFWRAVLVDRDFGECVDLVVGGLDSAAADSGAFRRAGVDLDAKDAETRALRFNVDRSSGGALHLPLWHCHRHVDDA